MVTVRTMGEPSELRLSDPAQAGPTVSRRLVGAQLRRLREAAAISRDDAGYAIRASGSKISRLELGRIGVKLRDVADLLTLYGVTEQAERATLLSLAEQANAPAWWQPYRDIIPAWFEAYLGLEQAASVIRCYEVQFIPGLLQTPDYARAVVRLGHEGASEHEIDRRVEMRTHRAQILRDPSPPRFWAVLDEAALRRPYGSAAVLRAQLEHLIEMADIPNVTLQVLPFSIGGHAAAGGAITILRMPEDEISDVVYLEQLTSAVYLDKLTDIDHYARVMNQLGIAAEPPDRTRAILERIRAEV